MSLLAAAVYLLGWLAHMPRILSMPRVGVASDCVRAALWAAWPSVWCIALIIELRRRI